MSAESAYQNHYQEPRHTAPIPLTWEEQREDKTRERLLVGFFDHCERNGLDPRNPDPSQGPALATAAHTFVSGVTERHLEKLAERKDPRKFHLVPPGTIEQRMRDYFKGFGTNRREKVGVARTKEEAFLAERLRTLDAGAYDSKEPETGRHEARTAAFPEIEVASVLHETLAAEGNQTAADSVEVLLAAYGSRFMTLSKDVGIVVVKEGEYRDSHNIHHLNTDDLPE